MEFMSKRSISVMFISALFLLAVSCASDNSEGSVENGADDCQTVVQCENGDALEACWSNESTDLNDCNFAIGNSSYNCGSEAFEAFSVCGEIEDDFCLDLKECANGEILMLCYKSGIIDRYEIGNDRFQCNSQNCIAATDSAFNACDLSLDGNDDDPRHVDADGDGYFADETDCNDNDAAINPGITIQCEESVDLNCDGTIVTCQTWYADADGDGYGNSEIVVFEPDQPPGYVADGTDCDDANDAVHPGATDILNNEIDENCDGFDSVAVDSFTNSLGMQFNLILPGNFWMGSPTDELGRDSHETQHYVVLTQAYHMQTTEVTQGQWRALMNGQNPSFFSECGDDCPVDTVSWDDIQQFLANLNNRGEGVYRLPTEAQWEYAARAGTQTALPNGELTYEDRLPIDDNLNEIAWYGGNSAASYPGCVDMNHWGLDICAGTHPVAQKIPNAWGLYDMLGNSWEWCSDWYGAYPASTLDAPDIDPDGPLSGTSRVLRGGSWFYLARRCRSAFRFDAPSDHLSYSSGFRLVCIQPPDNP